jgi:hypothetical protein
MLSQMIGYYEDKKTMKKCFILIPLTIILLAAIDYGSADAQDPSELGREMCLECHGEAMSDTTQPIDVVLGESIHAGFECVDCHTQITELPHEENLPPVDCGVCHSEEKETYKWHGRLRVPVGPDIPTCANCHGTHLLRILRIFRRHADIAMRIST